MLFELKYMSCVEVNFKTAKEATSIKLLFGIVCILVLSKSYNQSHHKSNKSNIQAWIIMGSNLGWPFVCTKFIFTWKYAAYTWATMKCKL